MMRISAILASLLAVFALPAIAQDAAGDRDLGERLAGFWTINTGGMTELPRLKQTLDSEEGRTRLKAAWGVLFEFTTDGKMKAHMGRIQEYNLQAEQRPDGTFRVTMGGSARSIEIIDANNFIQGLPGVGGDILYTRTLQPLAGHWLVAGDRLEDEQWYGALSIEQRGAIESEIEIMNVVIGDDGAFSGNLGGNATSGTVRIESTTPPAGALIVADEERPLGHFVRREGGAVLYERGRIWPLIRQSAPSSMIPGRWAFDVERAKTLPWIKQAAAAGGTPLDEFIRANVRLDESVEITPKTWRTIEYKVVDERGNQFAIEAGDTIPFWVRVTDEDHFSQIAGQGREFPFIRVKADPIPPTSPATPSTDPAPETP